VIAARTRDIVTGMREHRLGGFFVLHRAWRTKMAKPNRKLRPWTKEDVRVLKTLAREKAKTTVIARKLKRSVGATYQKARGLGVTLGAGRKKKAN
jgi:hypothetical protein